jgi:arabinose-5-phosphate isomerase
MTRRTTLRNGGAERHLDSHDDTTTRALDAARQALAEAARAAAAVAARPAGLEEALELLLRSPGRVLVTGLGKSGLIAAKLAATFASTGTPAHFIHAADALHGDAGMAMPGDVVIALSKSGETFEVVAFARMVQARGIPVISLTGCTGESSLCRIADVVLDGAVEHEADPWDLVPTTSTTVALMLGDALAVGLMAARQFGPDDFWNYHPGGALGFRLASDPDE